MKEYIAKHVAGVNRAKARLHVAELYVMRTHLSILMALGHKRKTLVVGVGACDDEGHT